jgi:hypothetical protein
MAAEQHSISDEEIAPRILLIRGLRVFDADLALLCMRAFVKLRELLATHKDLARKLAADRRDARVANAQCG